MNRSAEQSQLRLSLLPNCKIPRPALRNQFPSRLQFECPALSNERRFGGLQRRRHLHAYDPVVFASEQRALRCSQHSPLIGDLDVALVKRSEEHTSELQSLTNLV